ncbi:hypothetical protein F4679DRAFT_588306 [Xylaria curta]|nr:hypothetical protein F4679DRAFT_588306 [Xylaria curta]
MADRGDLNLAKQLQSEFSKAKPPKRKGRHAGGAGNFQAPLERQYQPPPPPQFGRQIHNTVNSRTADADQFFHRPRPSSPPPTNPQATARSALNIRQPDGRQPTLNDAPYLSNPPNNHTGTFGMPLYQRTNQVLPKAPLDTTQPASVVASPPGKPIRAQQTEEQEDVEMGDSNYPSTPAPEPTTTNPLRGLSSSMWNPANENARVESTNSSQAKPRSNKLSSAKEVELVTSGITKGPGLKASRWC